MYDTRGRDNKQTQPSGWKIWMNDDLVDGKKMLQGLKKNGVGFVDFIQLRIKSVAGATETVTNYQFL